ncbi:MAG: glutathione peroxidase, partial [Burkholderiaceae bacterium]
MLETNIELTMQDGSTRSTAEFAGKLVMVVNVASRCGLTPQYEALENLQKKYQDRGFTVLGVPSGSFKQELKSDEAINEYCSTTWGITFPMTEKSEVNGRKRHDL